MNGMDDLVEWLRTQLDEDERIALTWPADQRNWDEHGDRRIDYASGAGEEVSAVNVKANAALGWERIYVKRDGIGLSRHVAEHDPARVLREVDATRVLLTQYEALKSGMPDDMTGVFALETAVRAKGVVYADRPGYREDWRP
ncbi:DUF6221 family protein [Streptomyces sp. NPDC058442]|uniref:DUF6221 family protein n=1 Tax=Streptomyces sp. NPDC058442 TaxID=3346503 RepID=UPI0036468818